MPVDFSPVTEGHRTRKLGIYFTDRILTAKLGGRVVVLEVRCQRAAPDVSGQAVARQAALQLYFTDRTLTGKSEQKPPRIGLSPRWKNSFRKAQGEVLYNDDTGMRILGLDTPDPPRRKGVFTSGIISTRQGQRIALFFTGRRHAGENLAAVLARRAAELMLAALQRLSSCLRLCRGGVAARSIPSGPRNMGNTNKSGDR
jgi:hypothetical protein